MGSRDGVAVTAPDPLPLAAMLRSAVDAARSRDPARFPSDAAVARAAGLLPPALTRALRADRDTQWSTVERILAACGARLELVFDDDARDPHHRHYSEQGADLSKIEPAS